MMLLVLYIALSDMLNHIEIQAISSLHNISLLSCVYKAVFDTSLKRFCYKRSAAQMSILKYREKIFDNNVVIQPIKTVRLICSVIV